VQESLLRAWRKRSECKTPQDPEAWVAAIARREGLRVASRRLPQPVGEASPVSAAITDETERALDRIRLAEALSVLSPVDRALVRLRYIEDLSHAEISRLMDMREPTVRVRLHRARAQVRDVI
jgi:RNA polymerase sigma-70 factor (ECF subfamily)